MEYSIIFLVEEESDDFLEFFRMISDLFSLRSDAFEVIVVANATGDYVTNELDGSRKLQNQALVILFHQRVSSSVCLNAALKESSGDLIFILGPFQELQSQHYPDLLDAMSPECDLVLPFRKVRCDPVLNKIHSKLLNNVLKVVVGGEIHDIGCNAKIVRREVFESIELYGNMLKYLPALASNKGFKFCEIECEQHEKERTAKLYSFKLYLDRLVEITNLFFSTNFSKKPLRFFSLIGSSFFAAGITILMYIFFQKLFFDLPIGNRPLLMVAVISVVAGAQFASFGLLGEVISFVHGRNHKEYSIEEII